MASEASAARSARRRASIAGDSSVPARRSRRSRTRPTRRVPLDPHHPAGAARPRPADRGLSGLGFELLAGDEVSAVDRAGALAPRAIELDRDAERAEALLADHTLGRRVAARVVAAL